jgi:bleomycin hydrolase
METTQLAPSPIVADSTAGALTSALLAALREGYRMSPADRACHNAVSNNPARSLSMDRGVTRGDDGHFSHRVESKGITNQKKSGRCWIFAGLNILRPQVIQDHRMEEFEFSTAYLQFWDKMEKANLYLESIIELRDADYLDRDWEMVNKFAMEDGGWWNYLAGLVAKYGILPLTAMPETHASSNTDTLNEVLGRLLRSRAIRILDRHANGAGVDSLRAEKHETLTEVYRLLVLHFGEPPTKFEWRYVVRKNHEDGSEPETGISENRKLTPTEHHTPQSANTSAVRSPSLSASTTIHTTN